MASPRVSNPENLKFEIKKNDDGTVAVVSNVVFKEVLFSKTYKKIEKSCKKLAPLSSFVGSFELFT